MIAKLEILDQKVVVFNSGKLEIEQKRAGFNSINLLVLNARKL
jgi:hypothetical protein